MQHLQKSKKKQNINLPILSYKNQIIEYVNKFNTLIIIGETACGKSTQIPQILHDRIEQKGLIGCTQPRKVAAITIAQWVASSRNSVLGDLIGYAVRFENVLSNNTRIKYMTDGILLREALHDPLFKQYSTIIIDEIHERSLRTDILLSLLKNAQIQRNNGQSKLKLIIMSATMDVDKFSKFFSNCPVLYIEGQRQYPIQVFNPAEDVSKFNQEDYINNSLITLLKIFRTSTYGDVLVFLPGKDEIDSFIKLGRKLVKDFDNNSHHVWSAEEQSLAKIMFYPFYAGLSKTLQNEVFTSQNNKLMFNKSTNMNGNINSTPSRIRKCIVATNIAETSITIPNIRYIIDSGRFKTKTMVNLSPQNTNTLQYNYLRECLIVDWISQDQAWQRTGRAGRDIKNNHQNNNVKTQSDTFISHCYRLYFENNAQVKGRTHIIPEIERVDLSVIIPNLLAIGQKLLIDDSEHKIKLLRFVDQPPRAHIYHAIEKLRSHNIITLNKLKLQMNQKSSINTLQCFTLYVNLLEQEMANFTNSKASNFYNNNKDINGGVCKKRKKFRPFLAPSLFTSLFMPCPYTCEGVPLLSLTPLGNLINLFPLNPILALLLVKSLGSVNFTPENFQFPNGHNEAFFNNDVPQTKCSEEMCSIVALLSSLTSESGNSSIFLSNTASSGHDTSIHNAKNKSHIMPRNLVDYHSDHITMLNVYRAFKSHKANAKWCSTMKLNRKALMLAYRIEKQLKKIIKINNLGPLQSCGLHMDPVKRILYEGLCQDIAIRQGTSNRYILITNNFSPNTSTINDNKTYNGESEKNAFKTKCNYNFTHDEDTTFNERHKSNSNNNPFLYLHPHSVCFANKPKCVVFSELLCTSRPYMKLVTAIDPEWLNN